MSWTEAGAAVRWILSAHKTVPLLFFQNAVPAAAACMVMAHVCLLLDAARRDFVTLDESAHIASAVTQWKTGASHLYRVNPPLPRMLAVVPALVWLPDIQVVNPGDQPGFRPEFPAASAFANANRNEYLRIVFLSRLAGVLWSVCGCWLIWRWARETCGAPAALLPLGLWCFEPNVLAHAHLATPDLPATVAGLGATYVFSHYLRHRNWTWACYAGLALGLAQLTKFTLLALYVIWLALDLLDAWFGPEANARQRSYTHRILCWIVIVLGSLLVLNAGYAFKGTLRPLGTFPFVSRMFAGERDTWGSAFNGQAGNRFTGSWLASLSVPLPEDYVRGLDIQRRDFEPGPYLSYLRGQWRYPGWWYWYLYAAAIKLPAGNWALLLCALVLLLHGSRVCDGLSALSCQALPALALVALASSQTGYTNHFRYVLPALPYFLILTSQAARWCLGSGWLPRAFVGAMAIWSCASAVAIHPHHIGYFNELAGGPRRGHYHLLDSNVDWGQDLLYLKQRLDDNPQFRPLQMAYFNLIDPRIIGIEYTLPDSGLISVQDKIPENQDRLGPKPGFFAISVNYVYGHGLVAPHDGRGGRASVITGAFRYFQHFRPAGQAGYSIYLYDVSLAEANRVRALYGLQPISEH